MIRRDLLFVHPLVRLRARSVAVGVALVVALFSAPVGAEPLSAIDRLRDAIDAHPADPDLRWALARKLAARGEADEAIATTRTFLSSWPERRPGARVEIARLLLERGDTASAALLHDDAIRDDPRSGIARFYRGVALRAEGRIEAANESFRTAGELSPALRAETLLARALGLFDLGREDEAVTLLRQLLDLDPTGDTALRARLLLRQRELLRFEQRWRADAYAGIEYDDNVTLESSESEVPATGRDDFRWAWGAGVSGRPWVGDRTMLTVGYRYDQTAHIDLDDFDVLGNSVFASGSFAVDDTLVLRLDGVAGNTLQDLSQELWFGSIRPNVIRSFGREWGATRAFAQIEFFEYDDAPIFGQWERDGIAFGLGVEHFLPLALESSWIAISGSWTRNWTQAETDGTSAGFDGDFDYDSFRARGTTTLELPLSIRMELLASYSHDRYHNRNFSHFLEPGSTGDRKRRDDIVTGRIALSREIVAPIRLELYWRGTRRISNVDTFDYDKQIAGALVRVAIE